MHNLVHGRILIKQRGFQWFGKFFSFNIFISRWQNRPWSRKILSIHLSQAHFLIIKSRTCTFRVCWYRKRLLIIRTSATSTIIGFLFENLLFYFPLDHPALILIVLLNFRNDSLQIYIGVIRARYHFCDSFPVVRQTLIIFTRGSKLHKILFKLFLVVGLRLHKSSFLVLKHRTYIRRIYTIFLLVFKSRL